MIDSFKCTQLAAIMIYNGLIILLLRELLSRTHIFYSIALFDLTMCGVLNKSNNITSLFMQKYFTH